MITSIAEYTTTITHDVTTAHKYMDLYKDWIEVYKISPDYETAFKINAIAWMLGLL